MGWTKFPWKKVIIIRNEYLKRFIERYKTMIKRQKDLKEENENLEIEKSKIIKFFNKRKCFEWESYARK